MSLLHWYLPASGDGRDVVGGGHHTARGVADVDRQVSLGYLGRQAVAS